MHWCEDNDIGYFLGLARNVRLVRAIGGEMRQARATHRESGKPTRRFRGFHYRTRKSWTRRRRVVGKAEYLSKGAESTLRGDQSVAPKGRGPTTVRKALWCAGRDGESHQGAAAGAFC